MADYEDMDRAELVALIRALEKKPGQAARRRRTDRVDRSSALQDIQRGDAEAVLQKQREAEQALRDSEERFRLLTENIRHVVRITAPGSDRLLYVSPTYEEVWGASRDDLYHSPLAWMDNIRADDLPRVREHLAKTRSGGETAVEYRLVRPDRSVRWIRERTFATTDGNGSRISCSIAEDVTGSKQQEADRLAHEVEQRETLIREVHHRVKNHLQGIAGLLRHKVKGNPELEPLIESAVAELHSVAAVFGLRVDSSGGRAELRSMLEAVVSSVQGVTGGRISVDYEMTGNDRVFVTEREKVPLALVLNEIIFNAVKHGAGRWGKKSARITVKKLADSCRIKVTNEGRLAPGFSFARGRGTGLGLELVKSLLPPKLAALAYAQADGKVSAVLVLAPSLIADGTPGSALLREGTSGIRPVQSRVLEAKTPLRGSR